MTMPTLHRLLLAASLIGAAACAADGAPLAKDIYIRGAFNGWGTDNVLQFQGNGVYATEITISPGNHAFKIGYKDWSAEWVINPVASVNVAVDTDYKMDTHPGPEDYLFVKETAAYRFSVDVTDPSVPVLRVARIERPLEAAAADPHLGRTAQQELRFATFDGKTETAVFSARDPAAPVRSYAQSSSMQLRDPGPQFVSYDERADAPTVRSGSLAFDALFALAGAEMHQDAVAQIKDGNYNGGGPITCDCFETGEKWHYVWTRDLSYAATLGLAMLDPQRVRNSLDFKLSPWRDGMTRPANAAGSADGLQIVQDTGSGGSWPVSTDRISWAFGAEQVLKSLTGAERAAFAARALQALQNTIENDRLAAFDKASGLYTGEQSFLDWRDQSYAAWIVNDIASMASAKALSTNVAHYKGLTLAAALAQEQGKAELAHKYGAWAGALKRAINARLWLADAGMYSSLTAGHFDGAPMHKFDWLGQALAIVTGVADGPRAASILANYPHGPMGAPVIYPQQPDMPIYHNRALWPFVTAFGLKAAAMGANVSVADAAYDSLIRGAALNLSNMENLEWLSGQPLLLDEQHTALIGPVINSKRQLWSVGAYLGMVIENVFGVQLDERGVALRPFITSRLRREQFAGSQQLVLSGLRLHGKTLTVRIALPPVSTANGYYPLQSVSLDALPAGDQIAWDQLHDGSVIDIALGALQPGQQAIHRVSADPYAQAPAVFGPHEPAIGALARAGKGARLTIVDDKNGAGVRYNVWRDGVVAASNVAAGDWSDKRRGACYAVEAVFPASGNRSHHSAPRCIDGGVEVAVPDARIHANVAVSTPDASIAAPRLQDWGQAGYSFELAPVALAKAGNYAIQLHYHNGANMINLGISGGVKWLSVKDSHGKVVAAGVVQLPHAAIAKSATPLVYSTPLTARLAAGSYTLSLLDFYNMSYLRSNSSFSAAGGVDGPSNRFDIYGVRLLRMDKD